MSELVNGTTVVYTDRKGVEHDATVVRHHVLDGRVELEHNADGYLFWATPEDLAVTPR